MMYCDFTTTTHGKWILAGEHAVLRGHGALVFPIKNKKLTLTYQPTIDTLHADYDGSSGNDMHLLFWSVLEQGQHLLGQSVNRLTGHFHLNTSIPIGVGMGASAALCVAVARWFEAQQLLIDDTINSFAIRLEHLFHGRSSGLDVSGVAADRGIYFKQGHISPIKQTWSPTWFLSSCGQVGITSHCINQVAVLWQKDPAYANAIDQKMHHAVKDCQLALATQTAETLRLLQRAINDCADCFDAWGLISDNLSSHLALLRQHGALAAKPTGSGGGGYVISLWNEPPPALPFELIAI
jgi:mevalonate kinase